VQLEEPPPAPLAAVDFTRSAKVEPGDTLAVVSRLSSAFDFAPFFDLVRVTGEVKKPRSGWILGGGNATEVGMPLRLRSAARGRARHRAVAHEGRHDAGEQADGGPPRSGAGRTRQERSVSSCCPPMRAR
jgi:hypothetical protein